MLRARTIDATVDPSVLERRDALEDVQERGEWGEIVAIERITRPFEVLGLLAPDAPDASATAGFGYAAGGKSGFELSVGIATFGMSVSYAIEDAVEIPGEGGAASVGTLHIPLNRVTQRFRPSGSTEWFERYRYELVMLDPIHNNIGFTAATVPADQILARRDPPPVTVGGSAPTNRSTKRQVDVEVSLEIALPLSAAEKGPSLTLSASLSGSVSSELSYELPANATYELYWLNGLEGGCFVRK